MLYRGLGAAFQRHGANLDPDAQPGAPENLATPPAFEPNPVPPEGVPDAVDALPEQARRGAFALAVDQMADDRPVDVWPRYVGKELAPPDLQPARRGPAPRQRRSTASGRSTRLGDTAVTTRGTEVPVRYGLAELEDLTTSHTDDLEVNPAYPAELQPRERERAGAHARNLQLEKELNPKLLMGDVSAAGGAPIVSPTGVVESGNGRTIALRRSAARGGPAFDRYQAELAARGVDAEGMKAPVLVPDAQRADGPGPSARAWRGR